MDENQVSITALVCGFTRAYHAINDSPKIFDDFVASQLYTPEEKAFFSSSVASLLKVFDPQTALVTPDQTAALRLVMQVYNSSNILSRARFTEDCLEQAINDGVEQYVILGAGMDTFALRRPDLSGKVQIFEVDHPATQDNKKERLLRIVPELPGNLHLVPVNFAKDDLKACLLQAGFDPAKPAFFSWLGVTYYLEREAIESTLQNVSELGKPGSTLVFDYYDGNAFQPKNGNDRDTTTQSITRQSGETMKTSFDPFELEAEMSPFGFVTVENLASDEIEKRYFSNRNDLYHAFNTVHFMRAMVN